jgi:hypothetical protein
LAVECSEEFVEPEKDKELPSEQEHAEGEN